MIHRRLIAVCTSLSLLHLTVVGGELACTTPGTAAGNDSSALHSDMAMQHADHMTGQLPATQDHTPCDAPLTPDCCRGMTACSATTLISTAAASPERPSLADGVFGKLIAALSSLAIPPDPPPPKA